MTSGLIQHPLSMSSSTAAGWLASAAAAHASCISIAASPGACDVFLFDRYNITESLKVVDSGGAYEVRHCADGVAGCKNRGGLGRDVVCAIWVTKVLEARSESVAKQCRCWTAAVSDRCCGYNELRRSLGRTLVLIWWHQKVRHDYFMLRWWSVASEEVAIVSKDVRERAASLIRRAASAKSGDQE